MDFSKKYLLKYGWEEGQGLGRSNDGMKTALKPKLKFDKAGIGFDPSLEFTDHWWERVYNNAAKQKEKEKKSKKTEEVCNEVRVKFEEVEDKNRSNIDNILFQACEGRTAHKGARHGLGLSGKLKRLEEQEKGIVRTSLTSKSAVSEESCEQISSSKKQSKKLRKEKKRKQSLNNDQLDNNFDDINIDHSVSKKRKKKKPST